MADDTALSNVPPDGSLGLLAYGYRGIVAWRAARGTGWLDERRAAAAAARESHPAASRPAPAADLQGVELTVVSGLPRSGTSMVMQMLVAGGLPAFSDDARDADESNPRGYYEHRSVKALARDARWIPEAHGHAVKVVSPLLPHLPAGPTYRVVMVDRDIEQVLRSQRRMLERQARPAAADAVLRDAYRRHTETARRWAKVLPTVTLVVLAHADIVADPEAAAQRIADALGGDLDVPAMAAVVDPSLHRERSS